MSIPDTEKHMFLGELHRLFRPRRYLEIGVQFGNSLRQALPETLCIGVDPQPQTTPPPNARLCTVTSDAFFANVPPDVLAEPIDFFFIDGMHLIENVLDDFANCEERSHPGGVIVLDDVLPYSPEIAVRTPLPGDWAGDVWKLWPILAKWRPDVEVTMVDVAPTGLMVVQGLHPGNGPQLLRAYREIITQMWARDVPDPAKWLDSFRAGALPPETAYEQIKERM